MALPVIPRPAIPPDMKNHFFKHVCPPGFNGGPIDPQPPDVKLVRSLLTKITLTMFDRKRVNFWIIEDPLEKNKAIRRSFPSKAVRVNEGQNVWVNVGARTNTHTIHWHGIEPSPMNDGVGKHSFEINGHFVYQWKAGQAGTYFYHCHKNTTLHFEMGLYGLLIVDPPGTNPNVFPRQAFTGGPSYDVEAFWVPDDVDPVWHKLGHNAFMAACDPDDPAGAHTFNRLGGILNKFRPKYFCLTGLFGRNGSTISGAPVAVTARSGQKILIRALDAAYDKAVFTLGLDAEVIAQDGRPLGAAPFGAFSAPFIQPANTPFRLTTARRWDLLVTAPPVSQTTVYKAKVEFRDYLTDKLHHTLFTTIKVSP